MTIISRNYELSTDEFGLAVILERGRCTGDAATVEDIEDNCTRYYRMVRVPNASGAYLKSMDGTNPVVTEITPPTIDKTFSCVKVDGRVNPFAPSQSGGDYSGSTVLQYVRRWQEVGGIS